MRARFGWADLRSTRVGVWGLGVEGMANLRRARAAGADVVLVDDRPSGPVDGLEVLATDHGGLAALRGCTTVVKTPGISRYRPDVVDLEAASVPVVGGLGLWLHDVDRSRVVCITGTKGKSTTTAVAGHLLNRLGYVAEACGNLGRPPYDPASDAEPDLWIVETSSYQATDVGCSPPVTAVTSLHPDHLDWHGDPETYFADKLSLCHQPGAELTVISGEDTLLAARADSLAPRVRPVTAPDIDPSWVTPLGLLGHHNTVNALIAQACMAALGVVEADDTDALEAAAHDFPGLESRLRPVARIGEVDFVDDSLSTNVLPTLAAVDAFPTRRVALIAGGFDRGIDYAPLAAGLAQRDEAVLVLTVPDSGPRIAEALRRDSSAHVDVRPCVDLDEAVREGYQWAAPDGVVLLSPAAPSFGRYADYRHRARVFVDVAATLDGD